MPGVGKRRIRGPALPIPGFSSGSLSAGGDQDFQAGQSALAVVIGGDPSARCFVVIVVSRNTMLTAFKARLDVDTHGYGRVG